MKGRRNKIKILRAAFLSVLLVTGCGRPPKKAESPLTHAYRLIDANRDDEAIAYLSDLCNSKPGDHDCLVALASAYAHKSGMKVQKFVNVITMSKDLGALEFTFDSSAGKGENTDRADHSLRSAASLLAKLAQIMRVYTAVPTIKNDNIVYLDEAIRIMINLEHPRQVDALYRAVLRVLRLKHTFAEDVLGIGTEAKLGADCTLDLSVMSDNLKALGFDLLDILDDLELANPSRAKTLDRDKKEIANDLDSATHALSSLTEIDEGTRMAFNELFIQQGFGKFLKCKGDSPAR